MKPPPPAPLSDLLDHLRRRDPEEGVTVGDLVRQLGRSSFGMVLALPALLSVLPVVGALPGVSLAMATLALLLSLQMLFGRATPWLPAFVADMRLPTDKLDRAVEAVAPSVKRFERLFRPRLGFLAEPPILWLHSVVATALAAGMMVGALVPGGIVPPALGLLFLAVGLATHDGLLIALALATTVGVAALALWFLV